MKHITVTPADKDDEVILAGVTPTPAVSVQSGTAETSAPGNLSGASGLVGSNAPSSTNPATASGSAASEKPSHRETTLEDLESAPMPLMQRIVIAAAIVCIIGALVYCLAFMR